MRVFVTGGTGLVGTRLVRRLTERRDEAVVLSRRAATAREKFGGTCTVVEGDPVQAGAWMDAVGDCDAVIHLAGENVFARRWNEAFKATLRDSRVRSTANVVAALARKPRTAAGNAKVLVNASAIGYYGPHGDEELTEASPPGDDFLARLCIDWEREARRAEPHGVRVAMVRVGVVLDKEGGALRKLLLPFKLGAGGPVGSGRQWMSWIHHADLVVLFLFALDTAGAAGPLNGTAPNPVTNREFGKALGHTLHRPAFVWTPGFALRLALGEVADVITTGQRVLPKRPLELGYSFRFPTLEESLADIVKS
jgi:uncharacterized protein